MKSKDIPMQSTDLPHPGLAVVGLKMGTTWPQGCNPQMYTIKVHRQDSVLSSICLPCHTVTSQKMAADGMDVAGASLPLLGGPSWNTSPPSTPVKVPLNLHGPCQMSLPLSCLAAN